MTDELGIRKSISNLPGYKAGAKAPKIAGLTPYKLSSNENPFMPLPGVVAKMTDALSDINRYPDPLATELTNRLASELNVDKSCIALGTGSVGVCQQIVQALCDAGDEVIFAWRSFEAYPIITDIAGAVGVRVPLLADGSHDLTAMAGAVTERTKLIFVCTPNNPTGNVVSHFALEEFLAKVPKHILVVIDEAYIEFNRDETAVNGLAAFNAYTNVAVLRTFSKAFGLAGLRVGYVVAPEVVANAVRKTAVPFGVSHIAQVAAIASLDQENELYSRVQDLVTRRHWFENELVKLGFKLTKSQANFVWLSLGDESAAFTEDCAKLAIAIRCFPGEGVRITIGELTALEALLPICAIYAPN